MKALTPEMFLDCAPPHWSGPETPALDFADFTSVRTEAAAEQLVKLEQENARLIAKCEQQRLLMAELGHRVKNSLTLVQAMVSQTLREETSVEGAREALTARIAALGQSHAMLIDEKLVRRQPEAGGGWSDQTSRRTGRHTERFKITGPSVRLGPRQMLALSMALHELGTNAAKYGALSVANGRVEVTWTTTRRSSGRRLHLRWRELGGPTVLPPTRRGFGSKLIERALREALDGEVALEFEPNGVTCTVLAHLRPATDRRPIP